MKVCPKCGKQYPDDANFCPVDAGRLELDAGGTQRGLPPGGANGDGAIAGRFELHGMLGGGHTGDVYQALDRTTGHPCAVKLVHPMVFPNPLLLQRAERELKQLERVDLPEVARVLAHGRHGDQLWIAMELVGGAEMMRVVVEGGPMPAMAGCRLIRQVAHGLAEAAKQGVIHRDLAAKNILVDGDAVKIINFPIAVPLSDRVQGVAEFLSPEQVEGKPADQRSSIYSLGALLYFAVTGRPPFAGEPNDVLRAHQTLEPLRPSQLAAVPDSVEALIMKALEKTSAKRFMTLHQMIGELDAVMAGAVPAANVMAAHGKAKGLSAAPAQTLIGVSAYQLEPGGAQMVPSPSMQPLPPVGPGGPPPYEHATYVDPTPHAASPMAEPQSAMAGRPMFASGELGSMPAQAQFSHPEPVARPQAVIVPTPEATPAFTPQLAGNTTASRGKGKLTPEPDDTKGKFRETMWFKKGELDEAAAAAAAEAQEGELLHDKADILPIEDRYRDDGTLDRQDAERFSLRTGHTQVHSTQRAEPLARKRVSERELVGELRRSRIWLALFILALAGGAAAAVMYFLE
jgi:Protein kinase domain/zinc-ribbon domain